MADVVVFDNAQLVSIPHLGLIWGIAHEPQGLLRCASSGVNKVLNIMVRKYVVPMEVSSPSIAFLLMCIEFLTQPEYHDA